MTKPIPKERPIPQVGQVWRSRDKRENGRHVKIVWCLTGHPESWWARNCAPNGAAYSTRQTKISTRTLLNRWVLVAAEAKSDG